jgi:hypothetical protein
MLKLDHLTVIAPSLAEGIAHVRDQLDLDVPFGVRHSYMGTHNHRLQLGGGVYLEIVAVDPGALPPARIRWFGLDDPIGVRKDWDAGRRLRGWVAAVDSMESVLRRHPGVFGKRIALPFGNPEFDFSLHDDGSLPLDGAAPSLIDHRGSPTAMSEIPDLGARLVAYRLEHPDTETVSIVFRSLDIDRPPTLQKGPSIRYEALIDTPTGAKRLT